jgi:hypothetical protein
MKTILKILPACDKGFTSPYPMVVMVITVMYNASKKSNLSTNINPTTPNKVMNKITANHNTNGGILFTKNNL